MIVRDEVDRLGAAIASVAPVADEIVVVDTGSTDGTPALAQSLGARLARFALQDDFSQARNVALDHARSDWILSLDADQRLAPDSVDVLRAALSSPAMGQIVTIRMWADAALRSEQGCYRALRLFRRDERFRYRGRVHEDVAPSLIEHGATGFADSGVLLDDIGYVDGQVRRDKHLRNERLLWRSLQDHPSDLFARHKLLQTLSLDDPRRPDVWRGALEVLAAIGPGDVASQGFLVPLIEAGVNTLVRAGQLAEAMHSAPMLARVAGPQVFAALACLAARAGEADLAGHWFDAAAQDSPAARLGRGYAALWLARLARIRGDTAAAARYLDRAESPADEELMALVRCEHIHGLRLKGEAGAAAEALSQLAPDAARFPAVRRCMLLLAAMIAQAQGHQKDALSLAHAAIDAADDAAAAWLASHWLDAGTLPGADWLDRIPGQRFDTQAVRLRLQRQLALGDQELHRPAKPDSSA